MPQANTDVTTITRTELDEEARFDCLPGLFGKRYMMGGEDAVYNFARQLSEDYKGGFWHMYRLSNGAYYMAPKSDKPFRVGGHMTCFSGTVSADAFGLIVSLFAVGAVCEAALSHDDEQGAEHVANVAEWLRDAASQHKESSAIYSAID